MPTQSFGFYDHKMEPFEHQLDHLKRHCFTNSWALFWEQGTAKTKPMVDTAAILYLSDEITGMLIVAPPGVTRNWAMDEIPKHLPELVADETVVSIWETSKQNTQTQKNHFAALRRYPGLAVMIISYNAFMTKKGKTEVWEFLKARKRRVLYVLDESHYIKSPNSKRTKSILASAKYANYRRVLTGTPVSTGPFDIYSQIRFLRDDFWKSRGIAGSVEYRNYFGEWLTRGEVMEMHGYDPKYNKLLGYKNLEELTEWLTTISDRVLKEDVLDLPHKLYSKIYVELTPEQKRVYDQLREEYLVEFDDGSVIDGALAITRLLRFQQILCNYVPVDEGEPREIVQGDNPRIKALQEIIDLTKNPGLIFARFRNDIDQIMELFGNEAVRYDGSLSEEQAYKNLRKFQNADAQWFVATISKGGPGLTLHRAKTVVYYSNSYKLIDRKQSEDRAHRAGMSNDPVHYIDLVTANTVDEEIVKNLQGKHEIASQVLGDQLKEWLS